MKKIITLLLSVLLALTPFSVQAATGNVATTFSKTFTPTISAAKPPIKNIPQLLPLIHIKPPVRPVRKPQPPTPPPAPPVVVPPAPAPQPAPVPAPAPKPVYKPVQTVQNSGGLTGSIGYALAGGNCVNEPGVNKAPGNPISWPVLYGVAHIGSTVLFPYNHTGVVSGIWSNGDLEIRHQNCPGCGTRFAASYFRGFR